MPPFFVSRNFIFVSVLLVLQGAAEYFLSVRKEYRPPSQSLASLPAKVDSWQLVKEFPMEPEVQDILKADDTLNRYYAGPGSPQGVGLFIAFFRSQRAGVAPHSPKNCLPGAGWVKEKNTIVQIPVPGQATPVEANFYVVQRGESKSVVVYWYQSHGRTVADEFKAKFYVMSDAIRYNRTDTALVRVTIAVGPSGEETAEKTAVEFIQRFFAPVSSVLPV